MVKECITVDDKDVYLATNTIDDSTLKLLEDFRKDRKENFKTCPLCKKDFSAGDRVTLVISNNEISPNTWIHRKCLTAKGKVNAYRQLKEIMKN
ncbi:MAG TPA: hypothetical protein DCS12_01240 [Clostridiales bacterium]|jgi:hypothetical protein|nr:hypothetical protein [Clostridiales bacterium]